MTTEELSAARRAEPWREALRKSKKNKERADIPRVKDVYKRQPCGCLL